MKPDSYLIARTCPACGHVSADNRQMQVQFECMECSFEGNTDVVGAINILRAGHARFACEVGDATRSPAAGICRSSSMLRLSVVGILRLLGEGGCQSVLFSSYQFFGILLFRKN
ncbi:MULTISPECIES: zinc ribbon domain-containing protein [Nitrosomonas]|uniref:zinc ribbon domain-containing protein n=1 Tax=Nitrosomonas TaxID=914 RepID=UPI00059BA429|nr:MULTISPECIES: zinc ribbon domain-containing protein [Nitrosomonas]